MQALLLVVAVLAGVLNTLQSGSNSTLNKRLEHPLASATVVYLVGLTALALAWLGAQVIGKGGLPAGDRVAQVPWWGWIGGTLRSCPCVAFQSASYVARCTTARATSRTRP